MHSDLCCSDANASSRCKLVGSSIFSDPIRTEHWMPSRTALVSFSFSLCGSSTRHRHDVPLESIRIISRCICIFSRVLQPLRNTSAVQLLRDTHCAPLVRHSAPLAAALNLVIGSVPVATRADSCTRTHISNFCGTVFDFRSIRQ